MTFEAVSAAAAGHWPAILPALGITAEALTGRNVSCPGCAGKDRFRFTDRRGRGTWVCSGGGGELQHGDGFDLLCHARGLSRADALRAVADHLGLAAAPPPAGLILTDRIRERERAEIEAALLNELTVLCLVLNNRVAGRKLAANRGFREQRPEWAPLPPGTWEREIVAAHRIYNGLVRLYAL
jgi:phage/plasmid primase-like uncharacterized protein